MVMRDYLVAVYGAVHLLCNCAFTLYCTVTVLYIVITVLPVKKMNFDKLHSDLLCITLLPQLYHAHNNLLKEICTWHGTPDSCVTQFMVLSWRSEEFMKSSASALQLC